MVDHGYEEQARDWLESVDVPPPRLEVASIVQIGRAQVRRRRMLAVGGTAAVLAAVAAIPAAVPLLPSGGGIVQPAYETCDVTAMLVPDAALAIGEIDLTVDIDIAGIDATGRYVVGNGTVWEDHGPDSRSGNGETTGMILWEDGSPTYLPNPPGHDRKATDVNASGVVVGDGRDQSDSYAWIYRDGEVTELQAPAGYRWPSARSINTAGDIAGTAVDSDGRVAVVIWSAEQVDQARVLATPNTDDVSVWAITDGGLVVGQVAVGSPYGDGETLMTPGPQVWTEAGVGRALALPSGATGADVTSAGGDWAVGLAWRPPTGDAEPDASSVPSEGIPSMPSGGMSPVPVRWDLRSGEVEELDATDPELLRAEAVSAAGDVVMVAWDLSAIAMLQDGDTFELPDPVEGAAEYAEAEHPAAVTSDDGTVVVTTASLHGTMDRFPVMWRC